MKRVPGFGCDAQFVGAAARLVGVGPVPSVDAEVMDADPTQAAIGHRPAREAKGLGVGKPLRPMMTATGAAYLTTSFALELFVYPALYAMWRSRELPAAASASSAP